MNAIKTARRFIESDPYSTPAQTLAGLVLALESSAPFDLARLYELDYKEFEMAIAVLQDWRIDRYYASKSKLFDLSKQVRELPATGEPDGAPAA